MEAESSIAYILIAFAALALVGWILIKKKSSRRNLSPVATTAILLNIAGIFFSRHETFGYGLISMGLILSIVSMVESKR